MFPGNQNEQLTLKPLETKVIQDFNCSEFIFCSDAGLGSAKNRFLNSFGNRSYVITYSLKKMKKEDREIPLITGDMDETVIVTYSPKYKAYQQKIRSRQIERALKMIQTPGKCRSGKNQNDPARFIQKTCVTPDGEIADKSVYKLDDERINEEAVYDGFYAVVTNLEDNPAEIIKINKQRWEIEEKFTCSQILETLRGMQMTLLSKDGGYIPSYKRTTLTYKLHDIFGFRTDYEFISKSSMRSIISKTKKATSTKAKK